MKKSVLGLLTRSGKNQALQPHKMARNLKFRISEAEGLVLHVYLCSKNKGANQLHGYYATDLHLCFHIMQKGRFSHDAALKFYSTMIKQTGVPSYLQLETTNHLNFCIYYSTWEEISK